jgi:hypothetical protein
MISGSKFVGVGKQLLVVALIWLVEYRLLEGWTGGAPTVVIDKEDGSVLNSWSEQ